MSETNNDKPAAASNNGASNDGTSKDGAAHERGKARNKKRADGEAVVIKKYANRRLYNTGTSSYVTLDYLSEMVKNGEDFVVKDAKTGEDITRSVLTQIIFEEENKGQNLLPIQFLRQLIQFYGDSMQSFVPSYLEMSMNTFAENQEKIRSQMRDAFGATPGYNMFEETARQNMALFERALQMFSPLGTGAAGGIGPGGMGPGGLGAMGAGVNPFAPDAAATGGTPGQGAPAANEQQKQEIDALRAELAELKDAMRKLGK
ncbi:MAG: polyhydroxyalkanoate synthesis repressor PhaR [Pseudomonadota bacterium]